VDIIYYISGTLMTIIFFVLVAATIFFLVKPHALNKSKHINNPISRRKIFTVGLVCIVVTLFGFGSVMAATEPASVKQERITRELNEQKAQQEKLKQEKQAEAERQRQIEAAKPIVKTETETEVVPFKSTETNDSAIALGEKRVSVQGINGVRTITYSVTYIKGVETARTKLKSEITTQPVNQITLVGTYVAPVTQSTNSSSSSSGARTGAICNDGSRSSATGRGACSHHGGVAEWLY
jgi:hypothetical protein